MQKTTQDQASPKSQHGWGESNEVASLAIGDWWPLGKEDPVFFMNVCSERLPMLWEMIPYPCSYRQYEVDTVDLREKSGCGSLHLLLNEASLMMIMLCSGL